MIMSLILSFCKYGFGVHLTLPFRTMSLFSVFFFNSSLNRIILFSITKMTQESKMSICNQNPSVYQNHSYQPICTSAIMPVAKMPISHHDKLPLWSPPKHLRIITIGHHAIMIFHVSISHLICICDF